MNRILLQMLLCFFAFSAFAQQTITVQINSPSDDLEEWVAGPNQTKVVGQLDDASSDLELGTEAANNKDPQVVGMRFTGLAIPKGALITKAYIQFQVDATNKNTDPCNLWITAEDADNPVTFDLTPFNITSRAKLTDTVFWNVLAGSWNTVGQNGADQRSADISALVQKLVNRSGWNLDNAMSFVIGGSGTRESESFDGLPAGAPKLIVEFIAPLSFATQIAAAEDDQEEWIAGANQTKVVGQLDAGSSDLELGTEAVNNGDPQVVGLRFVNLTIPKGALIKSAKIQFQVDNTNKNTDPCNVWIKTQWDANPLTFDPNTPFNITSRPSSPDSVNWAIPAGSWNAIGQNGADQATSDLSTLVQAMVNRGDWASGNAMAFFIRGSGLREAESFDGLPAGAAKLLIEYIPVTSSTFQVSAAEDDLEEWIAGPGQTKVVGSMDAGSSDLELGTEAANNADPQIVGVRFANVTLPQGAVIQKAYLQFQVDNTNKNTDPCAVWIKSENSDNPVSYETTPFNITSRSYNQDSVAWAIPAGSWNAIGQNGADQASTDIKQLVQNLVNRPGWVPGNAMAFTLQGNGLREAESYDGLPAGAAKLIIEYLGGGGVNPPNPGNETVAYPVTRKGSWSYLDNGVIPPANWTSLIYNDTTWAHGNAPLGYGFNALGTTVSFGADPNAKPVTTYFRKRITIADVTALPNQLELQIRHDDGVVVYVNGIEVKRVNMPGGAVTSSTLASANLEGNRELVYVTFDIPKTVFVTGENVIAAEVHQVTANNDDLVFDLSLVNPVGTSNPSALGCIDPNDKHIACFTSLLPREQNEVMEIPSATHAFQYLHFAGTPYTLGGGNTPTNFDFTGYVPGNGNNSRQGHLSINHELAIGGVSVLDISYSNANGLWKVDTSGGVDFSPVVGTQQNCSGTVTPWGTVITCEEDAPTFGDINNDGYLDAGWATEIDPITRKVRDYGNGPAKLWALGRMEHENVVVAPDRKTLYEGEDNPTGNVYKFVADNAENLSSGKLYVLKLDQPLLNGEPTGTTGTWVLVPNSTPQECNNAALFAETNGTLFNGVEDVEINPLTGDIYFAVKGLSRTYSFKDNGTTLSNFKTFVGGKSYRVTIDNEVVTEDWGSGNDNLTFDDRGNLWVLQDGGNNYVWVVRPDHTQANPKVEIFMQTPIGSEPTGMTFTPDYRYMFISIQEPSNGNNESVSDVTGNAQFFNKSMAIVISRTDFLGEEQKAAAQIKGISPWNTTVLTTIGDSIGGYFAPGLLDGAGARKLADGTIRAYVNHELGQSAGYTYQLANGTALKGGRVSHFDIDPATKQVTAAGLAYKSIIDRAGVIVTSATQINEGTNTTNGIDRLCGASLFNAGKYGLVDDIFFTGEETGDGQEFALDVATETLYCLPWLGRAAWENVTLLETGTTDKVAILVGDDRAGAPLTLYVGDKNFANDGSFLDRNGLSHGKLYVWAADNGDLSVQQFNGTSNSRTGKFKEIAYYNPALAGTPGYDALGFANQATQDALSDALGAFSFSRPEDLSTNPANGRQVVLASTGRDPEFPADKWGTTYIIDFNLSDLSNISAKLNILYQGDDAGNGQFAGPDFGLRSPDNLDWSSNGLIYIQEDRSYSGFGQTSGQEASLWEANPTTGQLTRIAQVDRTAVPSGQTDAAPADLGNWETSGIVDVTSLFGATDEVVFLAVSQGHSLTGGPITANGLAEGGQLLVLSGPSKSVTTAPAQIKGLDAWSTTPLTTIGESINGYFAPGLLDGAGARKLADGTIRAYVNHELGQSAGYTYQLANGTALKGGRVSYFDIDPGTKQVRGAGLAYKSIIDRAGVLVTSATQINEGTNTTNGIDRLCGASLFHAGKYGLVDDIFFTGEETGDGQEFALDVTTETLYCLPWLGRAAWENVTLLETGTTDKVAILVGDDRAGAPLTLYVGDKNFANDGSFLDRNGLIHGKLYVWAADNGDLSVQQFNGTSNSRTGKFKEIAYYNPALAGTPGYDALGFANQATQDALSDALGAFSFSRPEDLSTNPANGRQVVLASTGRDPEFPADKWGTTYIIDFNLNDLNNISAKLNILYAGDDSGNGQFDGPDFGLRSPDNLDWSSNGLIYIQEDRSYSGFGQTSGQEASLWEANPTTGQLTRIAQVDRTAVPSGQTDAAPADLGNWETSGIVNVTSLFGATDEVVFLAVSQGHSLTGGPITANGLAEGGQLLVLSGPSKSVTTAPAQIKGLDDWNTIPLTTIGESINGYFAPGLLDGAGARKLADGTIRAYVNHELGQSAGYTYQLANGTSLKGGRVSYFDIDPASKQVRGAGLAYKSIIDRAGVVVTSAIQINEGTNTTNGIDRLCGASLFNAGKYGIVDDIFFTGEETGDGQEFALDVASETLYCLPWLGRAAWENVTLLETGTTDKVAILVGDDRAGAPLTLYVGDKNFANDGSFLDRNGLSHGKLYVWAADNGDLSVQQFNGTSNSRTGKFKEIAYYNPALAGTPGYDALGFANQATQDALSDALGAFSFSRPEDLSTNPANGRQVVLASTGRDPEFPADKWGTTYIIDFNLNDLNNISAKLNILYQGDDAGNGQFAGPDFGLRSPDNLDWSPNGLIYIQEDRSYSGFGLTSGQEASLWEANPATGQLTRIAQVDRTAVPSGQTDAAPADLGNWETSGIVDVTSLFGLTGDQVLFLAVSQGHSLTGGPITANGLAEGGQLVLVQGTRACELKLDSLYTACTGESVEIQVPANFDGLSVGGGTLFDTLSFTQGGIYTINAVTVAGCSANADIVVSIGGPVVDLPPTVGICPGSSTTLDAGNPGATFVWSTGATTQAISVNSVATYTVTVTNATGCSTAKAIELRFNPAPLFNLPDSVSICAGSSTVLSVGNTTAVILWSTGATTSFISVNTSGNYSVVLTNQLGCSSTDNSVVVVNPLPIVDLGIDTSICVSQTPWTISAGNFNAYQWNNGATTSSISVSNTGSYTVWVTDANSCIGTDAVLVTVEICSGTKTPGFTGSLNLFPNPTNGLVNLEMNQFVPGDYRVTVFTIQGQQAITEQVKITSDRQLMQLDMSNFSQGAYLIKLSSLNGVIVRRLIVNN